MLAWPPVLSIQDHVLTPPPQARMRYTLYSRLVASTNVTLTRRKSRQGLLTNPDGRRVELPPGLRRGSQDQKLARRVLCSCPGIKPWLAPVLQKQGSRRRVPGKPAMGVLS